MQIGFEGFAGGGPQLLPGPKSAGTELKATTVWLVDGDAAFRQRITQALAQTPDLVCQAEFSGADTALDFSTDRAEPEIILIGTAAGASSAAGVVRQFKTELHAARIIVLTECEEASAIADAIRAGASGYLLKSATEEKMLEAIREVRSGGASLSPQVARTMLDTFRRMRPAPKSYSFTPCERRVLELMTRGLLMKEIAGELAVSYHTVDSHLRSIYTKLHVHTRAGAVAKILREGLI